MIDRATAALKPWQFRMYTLRLDLARFDRGLLEGEAEHLKRAGVELTTLAAEYRRDPASLDRAYELHSTCYHLQPPHEFDRAPIPYHLWRWGSLEARDEALPDAYFLAIADGTYVGLSSAVRAEHRRDVLSSRFTGVTPAYQRRGIARALKLATVRYALEHDYRELRTTVLATNAAMLHLNLSLGFELEQEYLQSYQQVGPREQGPGNRKQGRRAS